MLVDNKAIKIKMKLKLSLVKFIFLVNVTIFREGRLSFDSTDTLYFCTSSLDLPLIFSAKQKLI